MSDKNTEREYELKAHLRELEQQRDELDANSKTIWQQEDDRDKEILDSKHVLEQMGNACSLNDKAIVQLIEEKQQMMHAMRNKRAEFATEFESEIKKKRQQIDWEMEDTHMELTSIQKQQKDEKEQSDKEYIYGVESDDRE
ncbi:MAG: hypothetical protein PUJ55_15310 [Clostridiales bacterium]|nr:hypothetical protein [Roseburia sp.]MDD7638290.1 hypothetical protein [Clostridiales bacterium]MDY4112372.1 hypothetical protein [Roseburia sp.]